jgi:DNA (cytosine-5)-methyltransferase 1
MKVGSLCTGYGGLEMAVESVFGSTDLRFVSDIDKDVSTLLAHHHPNVPNLGDLTKVNWNDIEKVDLLCAGYPCQPFSTAGKRKGEDDERAIFEYIADCISVLRPRNVLLENVSGHLTLGGTSVIATLTKLRYECRWAVVQASDAFAPHKRARLFIWANNGDTEISNGRCQELKTLEAASGQTAEFGKPDSSITADTSSKRLQGLRTERELGTRQETKCITWNDYEPCIRRWEKVIKRPVPFPTNDKGVEPEFVEWMMGLPKGYVTETNLHRSAKLKMLGNGVVPQQAALAIRLLTTLF